MPRSGSLAPPHEGPPGAIAPRAPQRPVLRMLQPSALSSMLEPREGETRIGRDPACEIRVDDEACSRVHARLLVDTPGAARSPRAVVEDLGSRSGTWVNEERIAAPHVLRVHDKLRIGETLFSYLVLDELELDAMREVVRAALTDALTGLQNRFAFELDLARELLRARRYRWPVALLLVDLDHFKRVNDTHGHAAGDHVLASVARVLRDDKRAFDLAGRYGGEEFVLALPQTDGEGALVVAERVRAVIEALSTGPAAIRVTASIGVAVTLNGDGGLHELYAAADAALYRAKAAGRNRVVWLRA